ncbi:uncharacterized protein LOC144615742 isoform X2 [Panthera onca]
MFPSMKIHIATAATRALITFLTLWRLKCDIIVVVVLTEVAFITSRKRRMIRARVHMCERGRGRKEERERIPSRLRTVSAEPYLSLDPTMVFGMLKSQHIKPTGPDAEKQINIFSYYVCRSSNLTLYGMFIQDE